MAPDAGKAKRAAAAVFNLIDYKSEIDATSKDGDTLETVKGEIQFKEVCFSYPTRQEAQVLKKLSLTIKPGKQLL